MSKNLKKYSKRLFKLRIMVFFISIIEIAFGILIFIRIQQFVDAINEGESISIKEAILLYLLFITLYFLITFISQYLYRLLQAKGSNLLQVIFFKKLIYKNLRYFKDNDTGKGINEITSMVPPLGVYLATFKVTVFIQVLTFLATLCILIYYNFILAIILLILILLTFLLTNGISKKQALYTEKELIENSNVNQKFIQMYQGINIIKQLGKENFFINNFKKAVNLLRYIIIKKKTFYSTLYICLYILLTTFLPIGSLFLGIYFVSTGSMTIGGLMVFYAMVGNLQEPTRTLADSFSYHKEIKGIARLLSNVLVEENGNNINNKIKKFSFEKLLINIDQFVYPDGNVALQDINILIENGDKICVKGESGSGKSTLLHLIAKLEESKGKVFYNGIDISDITYDSLFDNVLLVNQEPLIFQSSIIDNILLGDSYTQDELEEVIKTCKLEQIIEEHGYHYELSESGGNISGGQKQRIAIARILIRKPKLLLFDEVTSALDPRTAKEFIDNLNEFINKYHITLLSVSHKGEFDNICNRVLYI